MDRATYGGHTNNVDIVGDVHSLPVEWGNKWDAVVSNQAAECYENPFKAMDELYRVLKPGGILLIDCPYNHVFFGNGAGTGVKKDVKDYWRITEDGWILLTKKFKDVKIEHSGPNKYDPYVYMVRGVK
jgi:ubiquinone/menaquinone biosynthesis C-methylase UbiE